MRLVEELRVVRGGLSYPESPCLTSEGRLLCVEYGRDAVIEVGAEATRDLWREPGAGPAAVACDGAGGYWVCAYDAGALIHLDTAGRELARHEVDAAGAPLEGPNDLVLGPGGEVYFTTSGEFALEAPRRGAVLCLPPGASAPERLASGLRYANGIALTGGALLVAEHLRDRVLRFPLLARLRLGEPRVELDLASLPGPRPPLRGIDGIALGLGGELHVAHFGCARLVTRSPGGELRERSLPFSDPTNVALTPEGALLVTACEAAEAPYPGALLRLE